MHIIYDIGYNPLHSIGLSTPKGVLLYGPSGTGKTLLAKATGSEFGAHFMEIQGAEIWSRLVCLSWPDL